MELSELYPLCVNWLNRYSTYKYFACCFFYFANIFNLQNGFYRTTDKTWVTLERIQFVGACNPPTDPGRNPLSARFLRHVPVIYVDYPGQRSLIQIYSTFSRAMLRQATQLHSMAAPLTEAMVEFYQKSQVSYLYCSNIKKFTNSGTLYAR
jgi:hypothetical protein